jgi:hypothetical protein
MRLVEGAALTEHSVDQISELLVEGTQPPVHHITSASTDMVARAGSSRSACAPKTDCDPTTTICTPARRAALPLGAWTAAVLASCLRGAAATLRPGALPILGERVKDGSTLGVGEGSRER